MSTRLYLHEASYASANSDVGGTLPTTFRGGGLGATTLVWSGATTLRGMDPTIGAGQTNAAQNSNGVATAEVDEIRFWASRPLSAGATFSVATDTLDINWANSEANAAANFFSRWWEVYIWRPGTGAFVADLFSGNFGGTEANTSEEVRAPGAGSPNAATALTGDIIVAQVKDSYTQAMGTVYSRSFYYDGTVVNTTNAAAASDHASFIEFSNNLTFTSPPAAAAAPQQLRRYLQAVQRSANW